MLSWRIIIAKQNTFWVWVTPGAFGCLAAYSLIRSSGRQTSFISLRPCSERARRVSRVIYGIETKEREREREMERQRDAAGCHEKWKTNAVVHKSTRKCKRKVRGAAETGFAPKMVQSIPRASVQAQSYSVCAGKNETYE